MAKTDVWSLGWFTNTFPQNHVFTFWSGNIPLGKDYEFIIRLIKKPKKKRKVRR